MIEQGLDEVTFLDDVSQELFWSLHQPEGEYSVYIAAKGWIETLAIRLRPWVWANEVRNKLVQDWVPLPWC